MTGAEALAILAPLAKWIGIAVIVLGALILLFRALRQQGELRAIVAASKEEEESKSEAEHGQAQSAASGAAPSDKFRRLRKLLGR